MSTIEEILADVPKEGEEAPFKDTEKDTPTDSPAEKKPEDENQYKGFHEHPRWIQREKELEELKTREQENARVIAELSEFKEETAKRLQIDNPIPDWFIELYGENQTAWKKYNDHEQLKEAAIEQRLLDRQEQQRQQKENEVSRWNSWVNSEINKLQTEGAVFDRNELIKVMIDYAPTTDNNYDFHKGYKIYEVLKGKPNTEHAEARKRLADITTKVSGESEKKDYMTAADLRHRSWGNL